MKPLFKDAGILLLLLLVMALVAIVIHTVKTYNKEEYLYVSRGVICQEYNKESNTLLKCDGGEFGEVEILNPISVIKIRK